MYIYIFFNINNLFFISHNMKIRIRSLSARILISVHLSFFFCCCEGLVYHSMHQPQTRLKIVSQYPPIQGQEDHPLIETTTLSGVKSGLYEEVLAFTVLNE